MTPSAAEDFRGTDRFSIVRRIGGGGMGIVYEAFDRERRATVALKTLKEVNPLSLYLFKHEFRALAEIVHPNLLPLYELIAEGDRWFFTMELLEQAIDFQSYVRPAPVGADPSASASDMTTTPTPGGALGESSPATSFSAALPSPGPVAGGQATSGAGGPVPPASLPDLDRLRGAFHQLADGVEALHGAGKLHRDLKPSNVLVRADGRVVLLDFGLVAELEAFPPSRPGHDEPPVTVHDRHTGHSTSQALAGTVAYMSPEQAARRPLTPASDWYAVGVMLFYSLTGRLPFEGRSADALDAKQRRDAPLPAESASGLPDDLCALATDLLRRDPAMRPRGPEILARLGGAGREPLRQAQADIAEDRLFVGRAAHLSALRRALDTMRAGHAVVAHVHGRSGAGKSALIAHFVEELTAGHEAAVLTGRCYEQESVPYKAIDSIVDALTRHLVRLTDASVEALMPPHIADLARIFPVLNRVELIAAAGRNAPAGGDPRDVRRRAFEALRGLLDRLARAQPLVAYIDDVQWGDVDSAALLTDLLQPPGAPPVLWLLAYRSEYLATSPCLKALSEQEQARASAGSTGYIKEMIAVDALSADETRELATTLLGTRAEAAKEAAWVTRESGGSAFFVYELVEHLKHGAGLGPASADLDQVLWQRVMRLPEAARRLLEVVAVAGRPVRVEDAQIAAHLPALTPQVVTGLRAGRLVRTMGAGLHDEVETFHDRIREAIVARLSPETLRHHHAGLARSLELAADADPETLGTHFENAGEPARASACYLQAATGAVQVLAFDRAEALFRRAAALATTDADRVRIQERMIHFYTDMARFADAYAVGRSAVEPFGVRLPAKFVPPLFLVDFLRAKIRLRGRPTSTLLGLPTVTDERVETAVRVMNAVAKAAYQVRPELCVAVATKIVNLCLRHGNTRDCAIGYMVFGSIFQGGVLGNHRAGYEFGRLALDLVDRYASDHQRAEVNFVVGYFGTSWLKPATEAEALWRTAYESGLATGDLFHTGCACAGTMMSYFMRGADMDTIWEESERLLPVLRRNQLREPVGVVTTVRQAIRNLRGETTDRGSFGDDGVDEAAFVEHLATYGSRHFAHFYFVAKMQVHYLWGDYDKALAMAGRSAAYLKDSPGMLHSAEDHFYRALTLAALGRSPRLVRRADARFRKWASQCAENFSHKSHLLSGEVARAAGDTARALAEFDRAEAAARQHGYVHMEGLAGQLAARLLEHLGRAEDADGARRRAVEAYRRWGAGAYAAEMERGGGR